MTRTKSAIRRDLEDCQRSLMRDVSELMDNLTAFFAYPTDKESGKTAIILSANLFTNIRYFSNLIDEMD